MRDDGRRPRADTRVTTYLLRTSMPVSERGDASILWNTWRDVLRVNSIRVRKHAWAWRLIDEDSQYRDGGGSGFMGRLTRTAFRKGGHCFSKCR